MFGLFKKNSNTNEVNNRVYNEVPAFGANNELPTFGGDSVNLNKGPLVGVVNLRKEPMAGEVVSLSKSEAMFLGCGSGNLSDIYIGLGWDTPNKTYKNYNFDIDAAIILVDSNFNKKELIYYNNIKSKDGAIRHKGDNTTGKGKGDDEVILVNLRKVNPSIERLLIVVNIYQGYEKRQEFGQVKNAFVRLLNGSNRQPIARYNLNENYKGHTGIVVAELIRNNGDWIVNPIGEGNDISSLSGMVDYYKQYK